MRNAQYAARLFSSGDPIRIVMARGTQPVGDQTSVGLRSLMLEMTTQARHSLLLVPVVYDWCELLSGMAVNAILIDPGANRMAVGARGCIRPQRYARGRRTCLQVRR